MTATVTGSAPTKLVGAELQHEIEQLLYAEADLMDSWNVDEWYSPMAPDIHYWALTQQDRTVRERGLEIAAPKTAAYVDEDHALIGQRVRRMHTNMAWAEEPAPSRSVPARRRAALRAGREPAR